MRIETRLLHAGAEVDPVSGAVAPPLILSTTFARHPDGTPLGGHTYIRESNPTQDRVEAALAAAEGGGRARLRVRDGGRCRPSRDAPGGRPCPSPTTSTTATGSPPPTSRPAGRSRTDFVAMDDPTARDRALGTGAALVWIETPSNPLMKIADRRGRRGRARESGSALSSTTPSPTPVLQRPLELGADVVLHATTKYIGGHSDVAGGRSGLRPARPLLREGASRPAHRRRRSSSPFDCVARPPRPAVPSPSVSVRRARGAGVVAAALAATAPSRRSLPGARVSPGHDGRPAADGELRRHDLLPRGGGRVAALAPSGGPSSSSGPRRSGGFESLIEHRASSEGARLDHAAGPRPHLRRARAPGGPDRGPDERPLGLTLPGPGRLPTSRGRGAARRRRSLHRPGRSRTRRAPPSRRRAA